VTEILRDLEHLVHRQLRDGSLGDAEGAVRRPGRVVDGFDDLFGGRDRQPAQTDQGAEQPKPVQVRLVVLDLVVTGPVSARQQALADVVLDRRDRDAGPLGQFVDPHSMPFALDR
jgi:hypothetical protein